MGIPLYKDFPPTLDFSAEQKQQDQAKSWNVNVVIDVLKESVSYSIYSLLLYL